VWSRESAGPVPRLRRGSARPLRRLGASDRAIGAASAIVAGACLALSAAGCASSQSSRLMRSSLLLDTTPPSDGALVVFVRDSNPCDGGDAFRIVDDGSRFLGETAPLSKFAVRLQPGHHAFFAWQPYGDVPRDLYPNANQVGAIEGDFEAGRTYVFEVAIRNDSHVRKGCFAYLFLALHPVDAAAPATSELLQKAAPFAPDVAAGQAAVDQDRAGVDAHIALGMRKLAR
jgi:hypothetical protein